MTRRANIRLGTLDLQATFILRGRKYRTITYRPMNTCPTIGTRWCLDLKTLKAVFLRCDSKVSRETNISEVSKNSEK